MTPSNLRILTTVTLWATFVLSGCSVAKEPKAPQSVSSKDLNCMSRAIYFESNRSSRDGMIAVGSVVMNRVYSAEFPNTICGVVGQNNQFSPGVMTRSMEHSGLPLAQETARAVLRGERHLLVSKARFLHQATYSFPYDNMHYVVTAGGNAFYEKRPRRQVTQPVPLAPTEGITPAM